MASSILSAFPRPPTHIPTSPLPPTPRSNDGSTPFTSMPALPPNTSTSDTGHETLQSRRRSHHGNPNGGYIADSSVPRMSVESSIAFASVDTEGGRGDLSPLESTFSHSTYATLPPGVNGYGGIGVGRPNREMMLAFENRRRSLHVNNSGGDTGSARNSQLGDNRTSQYSQGTQDGMSASGSSSHGHQLTSQAPSAFSSRPTSFMGPGTPPLNVPLSASARVAALRAKRTGLGALNITSPPPSNISILEGPRTPGTGNPYATKRQSWGSVGSAGPPPTTPLPPIPTAPPSATATLDGKKENRKSINLASPTTGSFPFPKAPPSEVTTRVSMDATPTTTTFAMNNSPSGATFGHGISGRRDGDHSRGSSFGSSADGRNRPLSYPYPYAIAAPLKLGLGNGSVATFGGSEANGSTTSFSLDDSSSSNSNPGSGKNGHVSNFSTSSATSNGTAYAAIGRRVTKMSTESFHGGLAALSALGRAEHRSSPGGSQSSDSPNGKISTSVNGSQPAVGGITLHSLSIGHEIDDDEPIDVQKELEALRRERADRRISTASVSSNFSSKTGNTFRGASSKVMDVSPEEVQDDDAAELAGERLLGSVGDGLEGLASLGLGSSWGTAGRKSQSSRSLGIGKYGQGISSPAGSRPGSSRGLGSSGLGSRPTSMSRKAQLFGELSTASDQNGLSPSMALAFPSLTQPVASGNQSPAHQSSGIASLSGTLTRLPLLVDDDADETITLSRRQGVENSRATARDSLFDLYDRRDSDGTIETFETGVVGSGSTFATRMSAEMENRNSTASSDSHHLLMKSKRASLTRYAKAGAEPIPELTVEAPKEHDEKTPILLDRVRHPEDQNSYFHRNVQNPSSASPRERLMNVAVWNDAPTTPNSAISHGSVFREMQQTVDQQPDSEAAPRTSTSSSATTSTARVPNIKGNLASSTLSSSIPSTSLSNSTTSASLRPSLEVNRPDSAMSSRSATKKRFVTPPTLSISQATPLSSETSLARFDTEYDDEEDDLVASPSAGRDRRKPVLAAGHKIRPSEEFASKLEKDLEADGIRGEFALLQEVAVREKRIKLAIFGRNDPSTLTKPTSRRPKSLATIERKLPALGSPDRDSRDGASSPEIDEMIKRGRKSLSSTQKRVMRRRRSTGALPFADANWRRSEFDRALGVTSQRPSESNDDNSGRRGMDIDRDRVTVRDSIVFEVPADEKYIEEPQEMDDGASTDSSIDLHTPLPRLMLRDGLLSPHSKVLRPPTPEEDGRASWISSKNSLKVPRVNDKRKRRHRDGKLLREGVGLTTGLGWSDSEDEDAPSPLTRRLSSMTLNSGITRKASMASSINSFNTASMASLHLSRSPSLPSIPAGAALSTTSLATKHSTSSSGSDTASKHGGMRNRAITFAEQTPYAQGPPPKSNLKPSSTMSIIEHAQMLPTASLFKSRNHPLGASSRHPTFNFPIGNRRSSSPTGNSSQSSNGGVILPITPDADLAPSLMGDNGLLKDMSTPEDIQGVSGGTSLDFGSVGMDGAGVGLAAYSRGKGWPTPSTPTPKASAALPEDEALTRPSRPAEVRYSGGNFSYPTALIWSAPQNSTTSPPEKTASPPPEPSLIKKAEGLRKPTPRGLQVLTLPTVVAAGGRLSPRAGTFALPSAPSLQGANPTTPKQSALPLPGSVRSKSSGNITAITSPSNPFSRARSGSTGSNTGAPPLPPSAVPPRTSSRMPQPLPPKHRTLSGDGSNIILTKSAIAPPLPQTTPNIAPLGQGSLRKSLGSIKSIVAPRNPPENAGSLPKMLGVARSTSAPGSPPTRIGALTTSGKTGSGMKYRKSAGSATEATDTPTRSKIALPPPSSASRLMAPTSYSLARTPSTSSLTPSVVGVAL
ncbi:hypothetical protein FRC15_011944 [Serendipita sp. 397]|nr:hypothetical protein FRC15_011944 [Serendipita sp. 397]